MNNKSLLLLQAAAAFGAVYNSPGDIFYQRERVRQENEEARKRKDTRIKDISNELEKIIKEAIQKLPEQFRIVIVLRELQGLSYEEIAKLTSKTTS